MQYVNITVSKSQAMHVQQGLQLDILLFKCFSSYIADNHWYVV